jgi:hypothetical protein
MSLDKSIESGRERRRKFRGGKAIDKSCRNHGTCNWCRSNRGFANKQDQEAADEQLRAWKRGELDED